MTIDRNSIVPADVPLVAAIRAATNESLQVSSPVTLMMRPERLRLGDPGPDDNRVNGVVVDVIFVGNDVLYLVVLGDTTVVTVRGQNLGPEARMAVQTGDEVVVSWSPTATTIVRD